MSRQCELVTYTYLNDSIIVTGIKGEKFMMFMQRSTTVSTTWTIHDLATRQDEDEIFLDLAFQSTERWSKVSQLAYLNSVFSGFTPNPIILADVTSCMNYCEELLGKDSEDYKYYAKLHSEGVKYISV